MQKTWSFITDFFPELFKGGKLYYGWLGVLSLCILAGLYPMYTILTKGLIVTGLTDQISMGQFLANFVYTAHIAAAAILVVIPGFVYKRPDMRNLAVLGEIIAIGFVVSGLIFVAFHMGRPDRFWHMLPFIGYPDFPNSTLVFDAITLNVYLILNIIAVSVFLFKRYYDKSVHVPFYHFIVWWAIMWGPLIHIITAAVLGNNARMFAWNTAVLPFAFLSMAGASGPSIVIIIFLLIRKHTRLVIPDSAIDILRKMIVWSLGIMLLVFVSEDFAVLYNSTAHAEPLKFAMFGHHGLNDYVPWFWGIMASFVISLIALLFKKVYSSYNFWLPIFCFIVAGAILLEKPFLLMFPSFSPSPLGEYSVYHTTQVEFLSIIAIWAIGMLVMTMLLKGAISIILGDISFQRRTVEQQNSSVIGDVATQGGAQ